MLVHLAPGSLPWSQGRRMGRTGRLPGKAEHSSSEISPARGRGRDQFEPDDVTGEQSGEQGERRRKR